MATKKELLELVTTKIKNCYSCNKPLKKYRKILPVKQEEREHIQTFMKVCMNQKCFKYVNMGQVNTWEPI